MPRVIELLLCVPEVVFEFRIMCGELADYQKLLFHSTLWRDKTMIPVDVAALVLDKEYRKIDCVEETQPQTRDQSIQYERESTSPEGLASMKSPRIALNLRRVSPRAQYICFVVVDKEQELVKPREAMDSRVRACFSLEEEEETVESMASGITAAPTTVAQSSVFYWPEKGRVLLLACLYRGDDDDEHHHNGNDTNKHHRHQDEWNFRILAKSVQGKSITDQGHALRLFLQTNPAPPLTILPHKLAKRVVQSAAAVVDHLLPIQPNDAFIPPEQLSKYQ